jgi:hypothetical protein
MPRSRLEQETVVRFDRTEDPAVLYTASASQARRWVRLGYVVTPLSGGFRAFVPKSCVSFRRVKGLGRPGESSNEKRRIPRGFLSRKRPSGEAA